MSENIINSSWHCIKNILSLFLVQFREILSSLEKICHSWKMFSRNASDNVSDFQKILLSVLKDPRTNPILKPSNIIRGFIMVGGCEGDLRWERTNHHRHNTSRPALLFWSNTTHLEIDKLIILSSSDLTIFNLGAPQFFHRHSYCSTPLAFLAPLLPSYEARSRRKPRGNCTM